MENKLSIYSLDNLDPEIIAVTFAKCSRSPESFRKIAKELNKNTSSKFHEKWVIGYGHSSVAEHASLHIAIENISILASKIVEDSRLASYTEKSTRYQNFGKELYYTPDSILNSSMYTLYKKTIEEMYDTYDRFNLKLTTYVKSAPSFLQTLDSEIKIKNRVFDASRYILPTATFTNLGLTINARQLEYTITKLLSNELEEARKIGEKLKQVASAITPTLLKYAKTNAFIKNTDLNLRKMTTEITKNIKPKRDQSVVLVHYDIHAVDKIVTSVLYHHSGIGYEEIKLIVSKMTDREKKKILAAAFKDKTDHDRPIRELENTTYTFDVLVDYGAFRDIQRHRICTQIHQNIGINHGYSMDDLIMDAGLEKDYDVLMKKTQLVFKKIEKKFPIEAQYIIPLAYRKKVLMTFNLRSLAHFIKLRSTPRGHTSYRKVAQAMYHEVKRVHPDLAEYLICDHS